MKTKEAIEIFKNHNEWRCGAEISPTDPKKLSEAIDNFIEHYNFYPDLSEIIREVEGIITLGSYEAGLTKDEAIAILRKHQQPDRLPSGAEKCGQETCNHNIKKLPYLAWIAWAEDLDKKGIRQTQCPVCKFWLFPEEI